MGGWRYVGAYVRNYGDQRDARAQLTDRDYGYPAAAAHPAPPAGNPPIVPAAQPAAWRDTGKLPASANDRPPGYDPGVASAFHHRSWTSSGSSG